MFDREQCRSQQTLSQVSLDDRRPRQLADIVGQSHIVTRLSQAARNGTFGRRYAFIGPTGSGKTTLAQATARMFLCRQSRELGDACGECKTCSMDELGGLESYHEWTGAQLDEDWAWWRDQGRTILDRPHFCFFLDEAQDLSEIHQKALLRQLEAAKALVIFATTHEHMLNDALLGRFGPNKFDVRRPALSQAVDCMERHCQRLCVNATRDQLAAVARHYKENLRFCVDFVFTVKEQTPDGCVTNEVLKAIAGEQLVLDASTASHRVSL